MPDLDHTFGSDLSISATGDVLTAVNLTLSEQRVLRRLLTNPQAYLWQPGYGAGLPRYVGAVTNKDEIEALIRAQMALEETVQQSPAPTIDIEEITNGVAVQIQYVDADSGETSTLGFNIA